MGGKDHGEVPCRDGRVVLQCSVEGILEKFHIEMDDSVAKLGGEDQGDVPYRDG